MLITAGCSLEKQSGLNRKLQNITAHYNILFNANELLRIKQETYAANFVDSYNELLNVYPDTVTQSKVPDKDLELAFSKANKIINIKEQSHYLGDAYLVMGKARFLEGSYFDATEYLNYVIVSYGKQLDLKQEALVWKARSLLYLHDPVHAKVALDTAIENINQKKSIPADIYAAKLQYEINIQEYAQAEESAKIALQHCHNTILKLRWTFILAQLQELNQKPNEAFDNYTRIVKSNASFEMAFNANLNRIRIQDNANGIKQNKIERLRKLLKNQNNNDFTDQIYYQIAQQLYAAGDIDNAIKNYKLSVRSSVKNQNQKGLSYLRIADIDFKNKADYTNAKLYYDSTLTYLTPTYPGYQIIKRKSNNLQILTGLLQTISREDTLQLLAGLDEKTRTARIEAMVNRKIFEDKAATAASNANLIASANTLNNNSDVKQNRQATGSTFYFYNPVALSMGVADFKRLWGNRKLEDNWRRSKRSNSNIATVSSAVAQSDDPFGPTVQDLANTNRGNAGSFRQDLLQNLPLTAELLRQSNFRVYNAYMDMANFYRDVLGDKKEAINTYEQLLVRFPNSADKAAIFYNLYRLYVDVDRTKSDQYKSRILKEFPETVYAKVINDPDFSKKLDDVNAEFNGFYNQVYELYVQKKYTEVITQANGLLLKYPNNRFAAQLLYLKTIAAGHQEQLAPFMVDLQLIVAKYPKDKLVTPLAAQHLTYIDSNKVEMAARPVVLTGNDLNDIPFTPPVAYQKQTEYRASFHPSAQVAQIRREPNATPPAKALVKVPAATPAKQIKKPQLAANKPVVIHTDSINIVTHQVIDKPLNTGTEPIAQPAVTAITTSPPVNYIFSKRDSSNYYFAINVSSGTTNLASSRFGIGQYNRTRFSGSSIRHDLKPIGEDNQLIFIGRFNSLDEVKDYARSIIPLMPDIMKVPKDKYSFFIITRENLDKLADKKTLDSYTDYYQKLY